MLLPLFAPVVDVFAVYGLIFLDPVRVLGLWFGFLALQLVMGACAFRLDREGPGPLRSLPLQQSVYRQLMYLVVIQSVVTEIAGSRLHWQRMERYGSLQAAMPGDAPRRAEQQPQPQQPQQPSVPAFATAPEPPLPWHDQVHGRVHGGPAVHPLRRPLLRSLREPPISRGVTPQRSACEPGHRTLVIYGLI